VIEFAGVWVVFPVLLGLGWTVLLPTHRIIFVLALVGLVVLALVLTWGWSQWLRWGGIIWLVVLLGSTLVLLRSDQVADPPSASLQEGLVAVTSRGYGITQFAVVGLLALASLEVLLWGLCGWAPWRPLLTCLAALYLPLIFITIVGSCVWAFALNAVYLFAPKGRMEDHWGRLFVDNLGYDLKQVEWGALGAIVALGTLCVLGAIGYGVLRWVGTTKPRPGRFLQWWLLVVLALAPFVLACPGGLMLWTCSLWSSPSPTDVLLVYTLSAVRVVALVPVLIGPFGVLLQVLGDVVLYLLPAEGLSARDRCRGRLSQLLVHLFAQPGIGKVIIVAHSQGSVIAVDVLATLPPSPMPVHLVTIGSPLESLYMGLLGWTIPDPRAGGLVKTWYNLYRPGDYIGGPIHAIKLDNAPPLLQENGTGGHIYYFRDPLLLKYL
jgi:hypothetical protein